jgi:hypothetical protein
MDSKRPFPFLAGLALSLLGLASPVAASAQAAGRPAPGAPGQLSALLVYGDDFVFAIQAPAGWRADTGAAKDLGADVVFFPEPAGSRAAGVTLRVRGTKETGKDLAADLAADLASYRKRSSQVQSGDLDVRHPTYATAARAFFVPGSFYEYVAHLDAGGAPPVHLAVTLAKANAAATPGELAAWREVLQSITLVSEAAPTLGTGPGLAPESTTTAPPPPPGLVASAGANAAVVASNRVGRARSLPGALSRGRRR